MSPRVVLVAGSSSGIGESCVEIFQREGWLVAGVSRRQLAVQSPTLLGIQADLTEEKTVQSACRAVEARWGRIDAVVHSVGDIFETRVVADLPWSRWLETMDSCLGTAVHLVRHSYGPISRAKGAFVFISSIAARRPYPGIADYCSAKAALSSFSRSIAAELAPAGGRSNSVSPAVVNTPLFQRSPYTVEQAAKWHKLGRIGQPSEVACFVEYLAGPKSGWITGQDFVLDGGMLL